MTDTASTPNRPQDVEADPILDKLARTNTFDSDWPSLQHHIALALTHAVSLLVSGPSQSHDLSPTIPYTPTAQSINLPSSSPSIPAASPTLFSRFTSNASPSGSTPSPSASLANRGEVPSTTGGLIIPAFPPLDPHRKRPSQGPTGGGPSIASVRVNGHPPVPVRGNVFEDEWDPDVVIGGKMLKSSMDKEEADREVERLKGMIEDMRDPPFTIQRIAELLCTPFAQHSTPGKYLRAIEKLLLVTTPWEAPSYVPVPASSNTLAVSQSIDSSTLSGPATTQFGDIESTMPPRSVTPMFSPISFGQNNPFTDAAEERKELQNGSSSGHVPDGLMSPLILGQGDADMEGEVDGRDQGGIRSPAPEPEERVHGNVQGNGHGPNGYTDSPRPAGRVSSDDTRTVNASASISTTSSALTASVSSQPLESNDPAHQPYLGRVDELDTGPLVATGSSGAGEVDDEDRRNTGPGEGTGEGGTMTPHGMSERPVPISSTTSVEGQDRAVAGLPRRASQVNLHAEKEEQAVGEEPSD